MQITVAGERVADPDAANTVSARVQRRRENADAELPGQHRDDAACYSALGGHSDVVDPFAGEVIHAARAHHTQHTLDIFTANSLFTGHWIDSAIGKCGRHHAQLASRY